VLVDRLGKARSFSIYLLKEGFTAANSLKEDHGLEGEQAAAPLPAGASIFVLDSAPYSPWWKEYFGIDRELNQVSKGALLFLPVEGRCFALSFGHVSHNLIDLSYEYDFGLRVTLNSVDSDELKSTDSLEPGVGRRQRTQLPIGSDLTFFDFDRDSSILRRLTGKVKSAHKHLFKNATGASNLRINSNVEVQGLVALCKQLLELYKSEEFKVTFPDIQNISPVRDPILLTRLDAKLLQSLAAKSDNLCLTVPDLINYDDNSFARFHGVKSPSLLYDEVYIDRYYEYLESRAVNLSLLTANDLRNHSLVLTNEDGSARERYSIYRAVIFDTTLDGQSEAYHLCDGNWYRVSKDYVERLREYLDPLFVDLPLPSFEHDSEGQYNQSVHDADDAYLCLDTENIAQAGQTAVEPCDLLSLNGGEVVFWHVKISTLSSTLSHLFNQGANSLELIRAETQAMDNLKTLIVARGGGQMIEPLENWAHRVMYAIVTHKEKSAKSLNLPLFSRISLMRVAKSLHVRNVHAQIGFVQDKTTKTAGKKKKRAKKKSEESDA
jgi:uncharacterized protein (TIGR04141 family)